ncbi:unknown protein 1-like [Aristolochia californica]|uniref:unknown protein 1-like n=1 Tax=Aristolochia californica TaxID=171875 RepID=UPI0035D59419
MTSLLGKHLSRSRSLISFLFASAFNPLPSLSFSPFAFPPFFCTGLYLECLHSSDSSFLWPGTHSSPDVRLQNMGSEIGIEKLESVIPCSTCESSYLDLSGVANIKETKHFSVLDCNPIGPRTPADRGNEIAGVGSDSPLTSSSSSSTPLREKVSDSDATEWTGSTPDICTPRSHVFNPFAPGPEELALAPRKKPLGESRSQVARKLKFDSDSKSMEGLDGEESEESFLEAMYESIMDVVVSVHVDEVSSKNLSPENGPFLQFETPKHLPLLTGIAETCPGAPTKPLGRSKGLTDTSLCRKLEF